MFEVCLANARGLCKGASEAEQSANIRVVSIHVGMLFARIGPQSTTFGESCQFCSNIDRFGAIWSQEFRLNATIREPNLPTMSQDQVGLRGLQSRLLRFRALNSASTMNSAFLQAQGFARQAQSCSHLLMFLQELADPLEAHRLAY